MRYFELPCRGSRPLLRTIAASLLFVGVVAVLASLSARNWTPELLILLLVALALVLARAEPRRAVREPASDWRPWRGPNAVRNTLAIGFLGTAGASLAARPLFERSGDAGRAAASLVFTGLLLGSALAQTGPRGWFRRLNRIAWGCLTAWSAWQLVGAVAG